MLLTKHEELFLRFLVLHDPAIFTRAKAFKVIDELYRLGLVTKMDATPAGHKRKQVAAFLTDRGREVAQALGRSSRPSR